MAVTCRSCGEPNADDSVFCRLCGERLAAKSSSGYSLGRRLGRFLNRHRRTTYVLLAAVVVCAVLAVVIPLTTGSSSGPNAELRGRLDPYVSQARALLGDMVDAVNVDSFSDMKQSDFERLNTAANKLHDLWVQTYLNVPVPLDERGDAFSDFMLHAARFAEIMNTIASNRGATTADEYNRMQTESASSSDALDRYAKAMGESSLPGD